MTTFQQIENELLALGWTPEQGKGDHVKFFKEGQQRPIVLSRNMPSKGRVFSNTIANIRNVEPNFTLGRPNRSVKVEDFDPDDERVPEILKRLPPFVRQGNAVRWVSPEQRNWAMLSVANSLMNKKYVISDVLVKDGESDEPEIKVEIHGQDPQDKPFLVNTGDIEAWDLIECPECKKKLPSSLFLDQRGVLTACCRDCEKQLRSKMISKLEAAHAKLEKAQADSEGLWEKYKDVILTDIPTKDLQSMLKEMNEALELIPKKFQSKAEKRVRQIADVLSTEKKKTPFEAWRQFQHLLLNDYACSQSMDAESEEFRELETMILNASYSVKVKSGLNIVEISSKDWDIMKAVWQSARRFYDTFSEALPAGRTNVLCLVSQAHKLHQYILNPADSGTEQNKALLAKLEGLFKTDKHDCLSRTRIDQSLPSVLKYGNAVEKSIKEKLCIETENLNIVPYLEITSDDEEAFETAPARIHIDIVVPDNSEEEQRDYEKILEFFSMAKVKGEVTLTVLPVSGVRKEELRRKNTFTNESPVAVQDPKERNEKQAKPEVPERKPEEEVKNKPNQEKPVKVEHEIKPKNMNASYLDETNPGSDNQAAGQLTTRELLKELSGRGVTFDGLAITIKQDIDINAI